MTDEILEQVYAELEAPKTCEGCEYYYHIKSRDLDICGFDVAEDATFIHGEAVIRHPKSCYCSHYKPKEK